MKVCSTCGVEKYLVDFDKRDDCKDGYAGQCKTCHKIKIYAWKKQNPENVKAIKNRYYSSPKGKLQKKKEELSYVKTGGRGKSEARRSQKPISEARKIVRVKYAMLKRSADKHLSELDIFVMSEAIVLAKLRKKLLGTKWHVDHIIPISKGGNNKYDNIQVVPALWNRQKSNKHQEHFFKRK
jgi:hypothetical protein